MGWLSSDEPKKEEVQLLVDDARRDSVTAEILCKKDSSGWLGYDYLNDRPLIEHLDELSHMGSIERRDGKGVLLI